MSIDPYAAPKSQPAPARSRSRHPSRWWWLYFALFGGILVLASLIVVRDHNWRLNVVGGLALNFWALAGMFGFVRAQRLGPRGLWLACLLLSALQTSTGAAMFLAMVLRPGWSPEHRAALLGLLAPLMMLPVLYALARYVFDFRYLWTRRAGD